MAAPEPIAQGLRGDEVVEITTHTDFDRRQHIAHARYESESMDVKEELGEEAEEQERPRGAGGQEAADGHHRQGPDQGLEDCCD